MADSIFQNNTKSIPTSDPMISRVDMDSSDLGGRKSQIGSINQSGNYRANEVSITHVGGNK